MTKTHNRCYYNKDIKRIIFCLITILSVFAFASCGTTTGVKQEKKSASVSQPQQDFDEVEDVDDEEYLRSTNELTDAEKVSKEEFEEDKAEVLRIISELSKVMEKGDKDAWLKYIAPDSIRYYSSPANIRKVQKKLADKTIQLHGIGDYFKYVFIPSRQRSSVDEIRYISKTNVKAVEVKSDGSVTVYYYFVKVDGKWLVHLPTLA